MHVRAGQARRRREGVASHRPSRGRHTTQRASGDGRESPHGEQGVGDERSQRYRKPPDQSGPADTGPKEKTRGEKTYARGLTTAAT
jgi:hypothetical protein